MAHAYSGDVKLGMDDLLLAYRRAGFDAWYQEFTYSTPRFNATNAPASGQPTVVPQNIQLDTDSLFVWAATGAAEFRAGAGPTVLVLHQALSVKISDGDGDYEFTQNSRQNPVQYIAGVGGAPFVLPWPYVFKPGGKVLFEWRWYSQVFSPVGVQLNLFGAKLFTRPYTFQVLCADC